MSKNKLNRYRTIAGDWHRQKFIKENIRRDQSGLLLRNIGFVEHLSNWYGFQIFSSYWRCYYNFAEGHNIEVLGKRIKLEPGKIYLIPSEVMFDFKGDSGINHFHMEFFYNRRPNETADIPIVLEATDEQLREINFLCNALKEKSESQETLCHLSLSFLHKILARSQNQLSQAIPEVLENAFHYIEGKLQEKISIPQIAEHCAISTENLNKLFKENLQTTPLAYITKLRISLACDRLLSQSESLDQIAESLAFPNRFYFSRVFKKETGISPAAFRKLYK